MEEAQIVVQGTRTYSCKKNFSIHSICVFWGNVVFDDKMETTMVQSSWT